MTVEAVRATLEPALQGVVYQVDAGAWLRSRARREPVPVAALLGYARDLGATHLELLTDADAEPAPPWLAEQCSALGLQLMTRPADAADGGIAADDPLHTGIANALRQRLPLDSPDRAWRFAAQRAWLAAAWAQPGRKRVPMGCEFAQPRGPEPAWHLLADPLHEGVQRLVHDLNQLRLELPALDDAGATAERVDWLERDDLGGAVLAFVRHPADAGGSDLLAVSNTGSADRNAYRLGVPRAGRWVERIATASAAYGGSVAGWPNGATSTEPVPWNGHAQSLVLALPAHATSLLEGPR